MASLIRALKIRNSAGDNRDDWEQWLVALRLKGTMTAAEPGGLWFEQSRRCAGRFVSVRAKTEQFLWKLSVVGGRSKSQIIIN